ncbi:adenosine deaminase [Streptomyces swartbergensis]|uniref:Adenosine deaminase n=2 Tax=Streptomyces swartbergensis TaxID=487165 RepID=A0A243RQ78_9ACTN|nr:adenosine deaminase [Streptomyces swartbergensis]
MRRIALVTLVVDDYDEAVRFYTEALGFRLAEDAPRPDGSRWVVVEPGSPGTGSGLLLARAKGEAQAGRVGDQDRRAGRVLPAHRRLRPGPRPDDRRGRHVPGGAAARAVRDRRRLPGPVRQPLGPAPARHRLNAPTENAHAPRNTHMTAPRIDTDTLRRLPKAVLHDHLDGGLRPATVVELADAVGHTLPTTDPAELAAWYYEAANSGDLVRYIATFEHTLAVMQTREGLLRTAEEYVLDLAADGVVYGEVRYAPELMVRGGLALTEVVETVQEGLAAGMAKAAAAGTPVRVGTLLCGMRMFDRSREIADLVVAFRDAGVVGFDIAGAEDGFPPADHLAAFEHLRRENVPFTIHAGEAHGLPSIHQALQVCGAQRIGHGVRITDDIPDLTTGKLGRLAGWVRDRRVALEMCPTSNLQTGAATSIAEHPITALKDLGFRVTLNTDNRLVSGTTMTREMSLLVEQAGWTVEDLRTVTVNALKSAFLPFDERNALIRDVVLPGYETAL